MDIPVTVLVGIIGCVITALSFLLGQRKTTKEETAARATFEGIITEKLNNLIKTVDKLDEKLSSTSTKLYDEIDKRIEDHEKRYHRD